MTMSKKQYEQAKQKSMTPFEKAVERELDGLNFVSVGLCADCCTCLNDHNCASDDVRTGTACDEGSFSWRPCEGCGSSLGGQRYAAHGLMPGLDNELCHFEVCTDCLFYIANGDVPKNWEG